MGPGSYRPVTGTFRGIMNRPFLRIAAACALSAALFGCANEPPKHLRPLSYQMQVEMKLKSLELDAPILLRIYKQESELEVWKRGPSGQFALLKTFPICKWSGELGPKIKQGDRQAPEGFYTIRPAQMIFCASVNALPPMQTASAAPAARIRLRLIRRCLPASATGAAGHVRARRAHWRRLDRSVARRARRFRSASPSRE